VDGFEVVLVMQSCSHDAPYGEYFRIQVDVSVPVSQFVEHWHNLKPADLTHEETLIFARSVSGTDLKRWVSVLWVKVRDLRCFFFIFVGFGPDTGCGAMSRKT
jgi:hypothetical protein